MSLEAPEPVPSNAGKIALGVIGLAAVAGAAYAFWPKTASTSSPASVPAPGPSPTAVPTSSASPPPVAAPVPLKVPTPAQAAPIAFAQEALQQASNALGGTLGQDVKQAAQAVSALSALGG